jgi:hypothetical protein
MMSAVRRVAWTEQEGPNQAGPISAQERGCPAAKTF